MSVLSKTEMRAALCFAGLIFVFFILFQGFYVGSEIRDVSAGTEKVSVSNSKIVELEREIKGLKQMNRAMVQEMTRMNVLVEKALVKGSRIGPVKRTGGRPNEKDGAVSVARLVAVWTQMDMILDKLDEIIAKISK
ncbi:hypothetical protein ACFL9T_21020 [Thermodesulfobacteriota bacterium]